MSSNSDRLLDQALALVSERGWSSVGVAEICEASGLTKPTLYHYFGSKHGVLEALLHRELTPFLAELEEAVVYRGDLHLALNAVIDCTLDLARRRSQLYRLVVAFAVAPPSSEEHTAILPWYTRRQALLVRLFTAAASHHTNLAGHHHTFALTLQGMLDVHVLYALKVGESLDEGLRYRVQKQFMYGMWSM